MKNELVSVIMSVYKEPIEWVKESIDSILNQTYKNIEFIIVLDNPEYYEVKKLLFDYQNKDERIKILINNKNEGLIFSLNKALSVANGKYIARMDADDISHKERLEKQLNYLLKNNLDLIGSNVNLFNENGIFFTTDKLLTHKYIKKLLSKGTIGIIHPTFFVKKEVYDKLNGYSKALHVEDKEFLARVICNGFKVGNIKDVLLDYRYNDKSITKTNAIYVYIMGEYVTKVFNRCLKHKKYDFDENIINSLRINNLIKDKFNKKQILMGDARKYLRDKNYLMFFYKMLKAFFIAPNSTISSIKINFYLKLYKFMESIEIRFKEK